MAQASEQPTQVPQATRSFIVVRIRGTVKIGGKIRDTLRLMRLLKPNVAVVVPDDPSTRGMLQVVKDYVAYGEADSETLAALLKARGRMTGDNPVTDEAVSEGSGGNHATVDAFAAALADGTARMKDVEGLKPFFRLHPPRGGHTGSIKHHYTVGGVLGYQGADIKNLIGRMT